VSILEGAELRTARLVLRPVGPADVDALFALFADPQVVRYWSTPAWTERSQASASVAADVAALAEGRAVRFGVVLADGGQLVGTFSLFALDTGSRRAEIGYALAPAAWGRGLVTEAGRAVVDHAFDVLRLNRLEADVDPRNVASARVLERLGFRREGLLRERWIVAGEVSDSALYGLLSRDR
jgi:[ribosomal protein S5]-alanine N-acetyltransferase